MALRLLHLNGGRSRGGKHCFRHAIVLDQGAAGTGTGHLARLTGASVPVKKVDGTTFLALYVPPVKDGYGIVATSMNTSLSGN